MVTVEEARQIQALRRGEGLDALWSQWRGPTWAVCQGMARDREQARELFDDLSAVLPMAVRGWQIDASICCQMSTLVWTRLRDRLQLPGLSSIEETIPQGVETPSPALAANRLASTPPELRVIYLLDLVYRCPSAVLARLTGLSEAQVRSARAAVAWVLVGSASPRRGEAP